MTMERAFRDHAKAGQIPLGSQGKRLEKLQPPAHKNLILGLTADQPSEAAEAARILDGLRCNTNVLLNPGEDFSGIPPVPTGMTFGDFILQEIEAWVAKIEANHVVEVEADPLVEPRQIAMSLNPPRAVVLRHVIGKDGKPIIDSYYTEHFVGSDLISSLGKNTPPCSRQLTITDQVLITAATLLVETRSKQTAALIPKPVPARIGDETGDDAASPKKKKAVRSANQDGPVLCQPTSASASASAPATRSASASPPRQNRLRPRNKAKATPTQSHGQPAFALGGGHSGDRVRGEGGRFLTL